MSFATIDELAARLHLDIADDDEGSAQQALDDSTGIIQARASQTISLVTDDAIGFRVGAGTRHFCLPEWPVSALSISLDAVELVDGRNYRWTAAGVVTVLGSWSGDVVVTYTHGHAVIPPDLRGVCLSIAARIFTNPVGARRESAGNWSSDVEALISDTESKIIEAHGGPAHAVVATPVVEEEPSP